MFNSAKEFKTWYESDKDHINYAYNIYLSYGFEDTEDRYNKFCRFLYLSSK